MSAASMFMEVKGFSLFFLFVCRAPEEPVQTTAPTQVSSVCETYIEPSAIALYDYESAAIEDLSFNVSDALHDF